MFLLTGERNSNAHQRLLVVPPRFVKAIALARRAAKPMPPRVIAFVASSNATPGAVTDEDRERLQIRGTDSDSRIRRPPSIWLPLRLGSTLTV